MLKSLRSRRSAAKALAVGAVVGAGLVTGATPAQAAVSNCPASRVCFYDGANFTGFRQVNTCSGAGASWRGIVNNYLRANFTYKNRGVTSVHNRCPQGIKLVGRRATRVVATGKYVGELGYSHLSNDPTFHLG